MIGSELNKEVEQCPGKSQWQIASALLPSKMNGCNTKNKVTAMWTVMGAICYAQISLLLCQLHWLVDGIWI